MNHRPEPLLNSTLLRHARIAAGVTERGLARHLGTSSLRIRRIEAGVAHDTVTVSMLVRLAAAIGVEPADLLATPVDTTADTAPEPTVPTRALTIPEARILHRAINGGVPMAARGIAGAATAHLISTGVLVAQRTDPTRATTITVADHVLDALSLTPQRL